MCFYYVIVFVCALRSSDEILMAEDCESVYHLVYLRPQTGCRGSRGVSLQKVNVTLFCIIATLCFIKYQCNKTHLPHYILSIMHLMLTMTDWFPLRLCMYAGAVFPGYSVIMVQRMRGGPGEADSVWMLTSSERLSCSFLRVRCAWCAQRAMSLLNVSL